MSEDNTWIWEIILLFVSNRNSKLPFTHKDMYEFIVYLTFEHGMHPAQ